MFLRKNNCRVLILLALVQNLYSQVDSTRADTSLISPPSSLTQKRSEQTDAGDVLGKMFKLKSVSKPDTQYIKPGRLLFSCVPAIGYALANGFTGILSNNVSFYLGQKNTTNLSSVTNNEEVSFFYHQAIVYVASTIWTKENKYNLLGDWRYYKYPSYTYGLGGNSSLSDKDLIDYSYLRLHQEILRKFLGKYYFGIGYNLDYRWNIAEKDSGDFQVYNNHETSTRSSGPVAHLLYDGRKNANNPVAGYYASISYRVNSIELGSTRNWQSLLLDFRKYIKVSKHSENILAFWTYNWLTFGGKTPYLDLPSTGWDTYSCLGRGYIQGRLRSTSLLYFETEYRFGLSKNGLFGAVVFANAQSAAQMATNHFETILPAAGLGLRIKVNKYSGTNLCFDYGVGTGGSRGFFINLCEIF